MTAGSAPPRRYADSSALIVGGTSGIGLETARQLVDAGVRRLALAGRNTDRLAGAVEELRRHGDVEVTGIAGDAAIVSQAREIVSRAEKALGGIDVLVSSVASSDVPHLLLDIDPDDLAGVLHGQLLAPLLMTRLVLPGMCANGKGSVVLVASDAAKVATPGETVIGAAMAGITMFARTAALEAKRYGVRVNAVTPSLVSGTPTTDRITAGGFGAKLFAAAAKQAHLGVTEPADVAALIVFLSGPSARRITGQAISINSGISAA